jgi:hypothetical protein
MPVMRISTSNVRTLCEQVDLHCAAVDKQLDACDKAGVFGSKKDYRLAISSGMTHATERDLGS